MPKLTHNDLMRLGALLGYNSFNNGLCNGFSCMWAQALLAQEEEHFFKRLDLIASYNSDFEALKKDIEEAKKKVQHLGQLNEKEQQLLEVPVFFEGIEMYLWPMNHGNLFDRGYVSPNDINTIYPLIKSKKLEHTELSILLNKAHIFDKASLMAYLLDLEELLKKADSEFPILLSNAGHSVCLKYSKAKQKWFYIDTNDFQRYANATTYFRELETPGLVSSIFESLSANSMLDFLGGSFAAHVALQMTVLSDSNQTPKLDLIKASFVQFDLNYSVTPELATLYDNRHGGLLFLACYNGHSAIVEKLLKHPEIKINQANSNGATSLYIACQNGHLPVVHKLLKYPKIEINQAREDGITPLLIACQYGHFPIVHELLKHPKININKARKADGLKPLNIACQNGHLAIVHELLKHPTININQAKSNGVTPLYMACQAGQLAIVQELLKHHKIEINQARRSDGTKPLLIACYKGHLVIVQELLKHPKIEINQANNNGVTPLYIACQAGHLAVVELLLNSPDIEINSIGLKKHTPLLIACLSPNTQNNERLFQLLVNKKASLTHQNDQRQTALDIAIEKNNTAAISVLLKFICTNSISPLKVMSSLSLEKALYWAKENHPEVAEFFTKDKTPGKNIKFFADPIIDISPGIEPLAPSSFTRTG